MHKVSREDPETAGPNAGAGPIYFIWDKCDFFLFFIFIFFLKNPADHADHTLDFTGTATVPVWCGVLCAYRYKKTP